MPLSEHEQRLLDQIEQALYAEDPKFANIYRGRDVRSHYRRRLGWAVLGLVVGLGLLLAGVIVPSVPLGVAGFVVMLVAVSFGVTSWQRMIGRRQLSAVRDREGQPAGEAAAKPARRRRRPRGGPPAEPRRSVMRRLEDRWQRRQDNR